MLVEVTMKVVLQLENYLGESRVFHTTPNKILLYDSHHDNKCTYKAHVLYHNPLVHYHNPLVTTSTTTSITPHISGKEDLSPEGSASVLGEG